MRLMMGFEARSLISHTGSSPQAAHGLLASETLDPPPSWPDRIPVSVSGQNAVSVPRRTYPAAAPADSGQARNGSSRHHNFHSNTASLRATATFAFDAPLR